MTYQMAANVTGNLINPSEVIQGHQGHQRSKIKTTFKILKFVKLNL